MPTFGSLFAGVGGFDLGFEAAGFRCAWQVEIDPSCQSVLRRHWPDVPKYGDIREVNGADLEPVDVIIFGSPCQGLSVAGQRRGFEDVRSGLFHEAIRVIRERRPAWSLWENVAGALSSAGGRDFGAALDALADSGAVAIGWRLLDAQYFGVPQRRRRVFTLAGFRDGADPAAVLFEPKSLRGDSAPCGEAREGVAAAVTASAGHHGYSSPRGDGSDTLIPSARVFDNPSRFDANGVHGGGDHGDLHPSLRSTNPAALLVTPAQTPIGTRGDPTGPANAVNTHSNRYDGESQAFVVSFHPTQGTPGLAMAFDNHNGASSDSAATLRDQSHGALPMVASTLRAGESRYNPGSPRADGSDNLVVAAVSENQRAECRETPYLRQLTTGGGKPGQGYAAVRVVSSVRRLTPRECERLQGWPDDWTAGQPDSTRYRQIGNGVAAPVAAWIARRLYAVIEAEARGETR